jgi:hypothetical protein
MLFQIDDNSSELNQGIIEVSRVNSRYKYPDPCPFTWKSLTPLAFKIPSYLVDEELGTEMVNFSFLGNNGYLYFYYFDSNKKRVNVFRFFEPFSFADFWNDEGDCEIFRSGSQRMHSGLCSWKQLTWARLFIGD